MRIGITGAQSVGKTTLLNALRSERMLSQYTVCDEVTREIKEMGFDINEAGSDLTQILIMQKHIANVFMYDLVEIGFGYRLEDSFSGMINFQVYDNLRIGYAYDAINSSLDIVTNSSHEIFINFDLSFSTKVSRSPRYF